MAEDVLIHIGAPKAGSTTLQEALRLNAAALEAQGIHAWQPPQAKGDTARALANLLLPPNRPLLPTERLHFASRAESIAWSRGCWEDLAAQVARRRPRLTVLSSEAMMAVQRPSELVAALRRIFGRVHVLAYIRDPVDQYRSGIDQAIRGGTRMAQLPLPDGFWYPAPAVLERYRKLLGPDGLILRNFDRANLAGGDLVTDFAACIGRVAGQAPDLPERPGRSNESLSAAATLWLLSVNETFARFTDRNDRHLLLQRREVIAALRRDEALQAEPPLRLDDPLIAGWVRQAADGLIGFCNAHFRATGQPPLAGAPGTPLPAPAVMQARLHAWLNGQAAPGALARVVQAVTAAGLPPQDETA